MEVKLVITPSEEMVQLVDKVINAFAGKRSFPVEDFSKPIDGVKPTEEDVVRAITRQVEEVSEKKEGEAPKKRRTKAEIEAEKTYLTEKAEAIKEAAEQVEETSISEIITEAPKTAFVADVVRLRKMTVRRSELIGDVPSKLLEFGYNSVTSLAKDAAAAEKYFNYLVSVSPISVEDNA